MKKKSAKQAEAKAADTLVGNFTVSVQEDRILLPSHHLVDDDKVRFALGTDPTSALPTPLVEDAYYFVVGARGNDFQVTTQAGGFVMIIEDRGTGSNQVWKQVPDPDTHPRNMSSTVIHEIANIDFAILKLVN